MILGQPNQVPHQHVSLPSITSLPFPSGVTLPSIASFISPQTMYHIPAFTTQDPTLDDEHRGMSSNVMSSDDEQEKPKQKLCVKGSWSQKEDEQLRSAVSQCHPILWDIVAEHVPGRSAIQCKERWMYRLHPEVKKTRFEKWEDDLIIRERNIHGNHWTLIANKLPGRTSCAVKNRWYSVLRNKSTVPMNYLL